MPEKEQKDMASAGAIWQSYWVHLRNYKWRLVLIGAGVIGVQAGELTSPLYLRKLFNALAAGQPSESTVHTLFGYIFAYAMIAVWVWASRRVVSLGTVYLEIKMMSDLYATTFDYLLRHSFNFFSSRFAGSLTHRVGKYVRAFEVLFDSVIFQFLPALLFVGGAIVILSLHNAVLGTMLAIWSVAFVGFQFFVARLRQPLRVEAADTDTKVTGALADAISNQSTITLFAGFRHETGLFGAVVRRWYRAYERAWVADDWIWAFLGLFMLVIQVGLLYGAVQFWQQGLLTIGDFVLIQTYLLGTFDRLLSINRDLRRFFDAYSSASEMVAMLEMAHDIRDVDGAHVLAVARGGIRFDHVGFRFHEDTPVLQNFDLTIAPAEKVALVGPSGAGKSTITKLLLRLYDVQEGVIMIDGHDIKQVTQESLRFAIAFVPQEPILFHRSLMDNIRYGRRDATDEEVIEAAKLAHCHEFIAHFPQGYKTFVGERGVKLSGGERQRVAIARAILKNAPILMLDEATSSLDSNSELLIQDALKTLMRGKTVIVIAHRLSTIMNMDRIITIKDGRIVEEGTHAELVARNGLYAELWHHQAGGFIVENDSETV